MPDVPPFILPLDACSDTSLAGGKAVNLGILLRAGFPAPGGFVVTTSAFRAARGTIAESASLPNTLRDEILAAYAAMGRGAVAVRSSATAEDMAGASMAGQYDTFLHVHDDATLIDAITRCWLSLNTPRTRSYLQEHGIDIATVAMAVIVQRLVWADVAGVLFTCNPRTGVRTEMLIEATWGLGEALVSGRVQPDVIRVGRSSGALLEQRVSDKKLMITPGSEAEVETPAHLRNAPCLDTARIHELMQLGEKAAAHFKAEQDIEWAIQDGTLYLLQSRPITTLEESAAYERILGETRAELQAETVRGKGPWVRHNLGETLPHPTPLTWDVMQRFMTGAGGFGAMYRMAGFTPSQAVCRDGFLRLIAGHVYMETTSAGGMFFDDFPFKYDIEALRKNPDAAQAPPTLPAGSLVARWKCGRRITRINTDLSRIADRLDQRLRREIIPTFATWVSDERGGNLAALSPEELAAAWRDRQKRVLDDFAPHSLLPSLVEGMVLGELRQFLAEQVWNENPDELAQFLSSSPTPNRTLLADAGLFEIARGKRTLDEWLNHFGHRAAGEFDLSTPRWREQPAAVVAMANRLAGGADPIELHERHTQNVRKRVNALREQMSKHAAEEFDRRLDRVWRYIIFREDGKYYLMLGYQLLRDAAIEIGRRLGIEKDVFYLREEEMLAALGECSGASPAALKLQLSQRVASRKRDYRAEARISLPHVIDAEALATLGEPPKLSAADTHEAFAVSTGVAAGPARIVRSPADAGDLGKGYVLVCPSTDPNWTPLFVNAAALVLECGGTLSHGAVVAREMGLPAVVLADATRLFSEGQMIRVDGHHGAVGPVESSAAAVVAVGNAVLSYGGGERNPDDVRIAPEAMPPPTGWKDRRAGNWRNIGLVVWGIYLLLAFLLPEQWLYQPSLRALDAVFWPLVPLLGKPLTVAVLAATVAAFTMLLQRVLTDNPRLSEAKRRSAALSKQAAALPAESPLRRTIGRATAPVQVRLFAAAMVPLAILLGPLVMMFLWFPARMDPASWIAPPGTPVHVIATVGNSVTEQLTLTVAAPLYGVTPPVAHVMDSRPAREALTQMLSAWEKSGTPADPALAEQIAAATELGQHPSDLRAFLALPLQPEPLNWTINTPSEPGRWPILVQAPDGSTAHLRVLVGDTQPPEAKEILGPPGAAIASVKLTYVGVRPPPFWMPLSSITWEPVVRRELNKWDAGWLIVYLLAYLPAMFLSRRIWRVA